LIESAEFAQRAERVYKLVSLPRPIEAVLLVRGFEPSGLDEALEAVADVGIPVNVVEAIDFIFRPQPTPPYYPVGRFGDGTHAVFYSAIEVATCVAEVRHHQEKDLTISVTSFPRYFTAIGCDYSGQTLILVGRQVDYPDLVSPTDAGYPFCQAVARWAQAQRAQALRTTSARRAVGTCVPVFERLCLANPEGLDRYRFVEKDGHIQDEKL
jgi:hypothetical protein